ncbi:MAG: hypothetical protein QOG53_2031 [Frankiales bacterium]|jgi:uncharacterized delta-60 repeat protein|nr:hypothetical protein [Frankiales bacterium]
MRLFRRSVLAAVVMAVVVCLAAAANAAAGDLDQSYGNGGVIKFDERGGTRGIGAVELLPSGQILAVVSGTQNSGRAYSLLTRLDATGAVDSSFAQSGFATLPVPRARIFKIVRYEDGRLLLFGSYEMTDESAAAVLIALKADGSVETTFGNQGVAGAPPPQAHDRPQDVAVTRDGWIFVAMRGYQPGGFRILRFTADGHRDTSFGTNGVLSSPWPGADARIGALRALRGGGFVAVGDVGAAAGRSYLAVADYNSDGTLNTAFDGNGQARYALTQSGDYGEGVLELPSGDLLFSVDSPVAGSLREDTYLLRTHADGSRRSSFGSNGQVRVGTADIEHGAVGVARLASTLVVTRSSAQGPLISAIDLLDIDSGLPITSFGSAGERVLPDEAVGILGFDTQSRMYDSGLQDAPFAPYDVIERRLLN